MSRRDWLRRAAGAAVFVAGASPARGASSRDAPLAALRAGGCVVLLRHARTTPGIGDPPGFRLEACDTQRNLSAEGRAQAAAFGGALREAGIRIDAVRSSRWCRCLDTALLAFGRVEPWSELDSFFERPDEGRERTAAVRAWALAFGGRGNAVLVTHQVNATALTGEGLGMGEALVLRPDSGGLAVAGRLGG